jgi:exosome complex exonuclease DIS3/RRP44
MSVCVCVCVCVCFPAFTMCDRHHSPPFLTPGATHAVLNYRHTMAQKASRSSAELYTHLFFKGKVLEEEAYIIRVMKNGVVALIPKFGLEGTVITAGFAYLTGPARLVEEGEVEAEGPEQGAEPRVLRLFMRIRVRISIQENAFSRNKLLLELLA